MQLHLLQDGKLMGNEPLAITLVKALNVPLTLMTRDDQTRAFVTQATRVSSMLLEYPRRPLYAFVSIYICISKSLISFRKIY